MLLVRLFFVAASYWRRFSTLSFYVFLLLDRRSVGTVVFLPLIKDFKGSRAGRHA